SSPEASVRTPPAITAALRPSAWASRPAITAPPMLGWGGCNDIAARTLQPGGQPFQAKLAAGARLPRRGHAGVGLAAGDRRRSARDFEPTLEEVDRCLHSGWADPDRSVRQHGELAIWQGAVGAGALFDRAERVAVADQDQRGHGDRGQVVDGVAAGLAKPVGRPGEDLLPVVRALSRVVV